MELGRKGLGTVKNLGGKIKKKKAHYSYVDAGYRGTP